MIQQFIHTIAKEEIAKLTVEEFKGRIITILSKEEADKAVELSACAGRQRRHIVAAGLGHHARRHRGIFAADDLHIGKPL